MEKEYIVRVPIAGYMSFTVKAKNEEQAINNALASDVILDVKEGETDNGSEMEEWDLYRKTCEGNINYTPLWEAEAEEI